MKKMAFVGLIIFVGGVGLLYLSFRVMSNLKGWHAPLDAILSLMFGIVGIASGAALIIYHQFLKDG